MIIGLLLVLQVGTQPVYDQVILGGHVMLSRSKRAFAPGQSDRSPAA